MTGPPDPAALRDRMVRDQVERRGVRHARVLAAMRKVPRHRFAPGVSLGEAHADHPVGIGHGQTISQPYIVGLMLEALDPRPDDRVLEVGAGSGYQAALLAELAGEVHAVEYVAELAETATQRCRALGYENLSVHTGDGTVGLAAHVPFDGIIVAAAAPEIAPPLIEQLAVGGRLVIPVGGRGLQRLVVATRRADGGVGERSLGECIFVPLLGAYGWPS